MWPNEMRSVRGTGLWSNCYFRPPRLSLRDSTQLCLVVAAVDPFLSQPYSALVCAFFLSYYRALHPSLLHLCARRGTRASSAE